MASDLATPVPTSAPCCATRSEETLTNVLSDATTEDFLPEELFSALAAIFAPRGVTDFSARIAAAISRGAITEESSGSVAVAVADKKGVGARGEAADATESGAGASEEAGADSWAGAGAGAGGSAVADVDDEPGAEGESVGAEREKEVATVGDRVSGTVFAAGTSELNGNASGAVSRAGEDGEDRSGAANAGAAGDVKAIACGAWNAEAKSGAGAVPGAEANWRESISAGAKLRRAVAGASESVETSAELASEGREVDAESKEWRRAPVSGERGDGECGEGAAARAEDGATSGAGPAMRAGAVGAVDAAAYSTAPENGTARAVGTAVGVDWAAGAAGAPAKGVSDRGANAVGNSAAE